MLNISNPGFKDFRADASCTVRPQALIGEKYVDCLPTQPRVEGTPLPPPLKRIPSGREGAGQRLLPGPEHQQPGRRRPARGHQPPARTPAADDHPQRTGRRPRRPRQRPERSDPPGEPGAAGIRQGPGDPRRREQGAGEARRRLRPGARALRPGARPRRRLPRPEQQGRAGQRRPPRGPRPQPPALPALPARARPGDGTARPLRRRNHTRVQEPAGRGARDQRGLHPPAAVLQELGNVLHGPGPDRQKIGAGVAGDAAAARPPSVAGQLGRAVQRQPRRTLHEPAGHGRSRADPGLHLPRCRRGQRLRPARALPARRRRRHHVPEKRGHRTARVWAQAAEHGGKQRHQGEHRTGHRSRHGPHACGHQRRHARPRRSPNTPDRCQRRANSRGAGAGSSKAQPVGGSTAGTTYYSPSAEGSEAGGLLLNYLLGN